PPFGRFAGGRTQPFRTNSLPAAPRGRDNAPGPEGRSSSRQNPRPSAPHGEVDQADRTSSRIPERKEFRPRLPIMDRICADDLQVGQEFQNSQGVVRSPREALSRENSLRLSKTRPDRLRRKNQYTVGQSGDQPDANPNMQSGQGGHRKRRERPPLRTVFR